ITQVSTHIPAFLVKLYSESKDGAAPKGPAAAMAANRAMGISDASDTFQEQRRIYIRGFATSSKDTDLALKVKNFFTNLVPHDDQPDHPDNLFTDVWDIYCSKPQSNGKDYAVEFVLE